MKILTDTGLVAFWNKIKQLVLGNRPYNPSEFSGKGYKVLEKNIQTIGGVKKNIITAVMLSEANTIYEVRYDFDLNGETIEMQEGCTLKFEGGSLANGTIDANNAIIDSDPIRIFMDIILSGKINTPFVYTEWFGAQGDGTTDDTKAFVSALSTFRVVKLLKKTYYISESLEIPSGCTLEGSSKGPEWNSTTNDGNTIIKTGKSGGIVLAGKFTTIKNIAFSPMYKDNAKSCITISTESEWTVQHRIEDCKIESYDIGIELLSTMGTALNVFNSIHINSCKIGVKNVNQVSGDTSYSNQFNNCSFWHCNKSLYIGNGLYEFISCGLQIQNVSAFEFVPLCSAHFTSCHIECDSALATNGSVIIASGAKNITFSSCEFIGKKNAEANIGWFYTDNSSNISLCNCDISYYDTDSIFPLVNKNNTELSDLNAGLINITNCLYRKSKKKTYILENIPLNLLHLIRIDNVIYQSISNITSYIIHRRFSKIPSIIGVVDSTTYEFIKYGLYDGNHYIDLDHSTGKLKIAYHNGSYPQAANLNEWTSLQSSGKVADGVLLIDGNKKLIISPTQDNTAIIWASSNKDGGAIKSNRIDAVNDNDGHSNTASINAAYNGETTAASICLKYSNGSIGAGDWWLPSFGEMLLISAYVKDINYALSLIKDSDQISENSIYWTSTEASESTAYALRPCDLYSEKKGWSKSLKVPVVRAITSLI